MFMRRKLFLMVPIGIAAVVVFGFLGGQAVRLLWNWLLPPLFGWPAITFWQALGLLALCRILFGGRGGHGWGRRTARMTPEEREHFRQRMRQRMGFEDPPPTNLEL
jgi:hypothetical protein